MIETWVHLWARFLATKERTSVGDIFTKAAEALMTSGPMALVLFAAIIVLWRENKDLQKRLLDLFERIAKMGEDGK